MRLYSEHVGATVLLAPTGICVVSCNGLFLKSGDNKEPINDLGLSKTPTQVVIDCRVIHVVQPYFTVRINAIDLTPQIIPNHSRTRRRAMVGSGYAHLQAVEPSNST